MNIFKNRATRNLVIFWIIAIPLLVAFFFVLQWKNDPKKMMHVAYTTSKVLPLGDKYDSALAIGEYILQEDDVERTYLVLLQNNMELRPGGGYIGSFAIVTIKDGSVVRSAVHDTANFDGRIPDEIAPPYPMKETMHIPSLKLRDSNWMPDFPTNARLAENFYALGQGEEVFDGVIAVNASILDTVLAITGPITISGYPEVFESGNAVMTLEYQVERGYKDLGIKKGDRKVIMDKLLKEIVVHMHDLSWREKVGLMDHFIHALDSRDIQLYLNDERMAQIVESVQWDGAVDTSWDKDYLMVVDANLASYKTDHVVERSIDYAVDLSGSIPQSILTLHYENTATQKDWKTNDYQVYVRVYTPDNTWFTDIDGCVLPPQYGTKYGKKYVGCLVHVKLGSARDVVVRYNLPIDLKNSYPYDLKIQKQSGVHDVPVRVRVQDPGTGPAEEYAVIMDTDIILSQTR
jgi:hypothetical protein